ncbi:CbiM protein C-terminal domain-like protein [Haloferax volcanii DSM 14919]|uniref:CbiM protein C-terminal domain-like protein n=1 Tax=Haloferax lucentense (strain DSM 14919 / JCM 9276 / NCIMB 13854 / Aa 2.2) TaxID=1230452 RepID=M0GZ86_HALL2|nr:PDGLE domain-containing protein [Haloferax lucentense]ELZ76179.1 CbiM protein C-terminal domain-like protein [Haloferax lucentense DSM 14919]
MNALVSDTWGRRALIGLLVLVVLAPVFGWASGAVGYAEPLENAAEETGAADAADPVSPGLLPDYSVPGLSSPLGTLVSAVVGTGVTLAVGVGVGRLLEQ